MASSNKRAKQQAQKRERDYRHKLNALKKVGAYEPKGGELTRYRKSRINSLWRELGDKVEPAPGARASYFFVGTDKLNSKQRKGFLDNARSLDIATTKKGIFLQREGQRRARLQYNKENDEFDVVLTGKVKWGENKGKRITDRIPIGPVDRIGRELERIKNVADKFGTMKKGEAISFVVVEQGEEVGASQSTFSGSNAAERLRDYIDTRYHRDNKAAKLKFLRMARVRKTTLTQWEQDHPPKPRRMARRGKKPKGYNPH